MDSPEAVHVIAEASNLAFADRNKYLADPDYVQVPVEQMLNPVYLQKRAALISLYRVMGKAEPGEFKGAVKQPSAVQFIEVPSTTHLSIVDAEGNAVAMTTSIEQAFGSGLMVRGFLLNNQLTDFSFQREGESNWMEPGKRPRSSMAPTLVFDRKTGDLLFVVGSPGGARIISYVVKTLIGVLDYSMNPQDAISFPNFSSRNGPLEIEKGTGLVDLVPALKKKGHVVHVLDLNSGVQGIEIRGDGLVGGADPRREGVVIGEDWCEY